MKQLSEAMEIVNKNFEELLEEIKSGKSERLMKYFEFCSHFYKYSVNNQELILAQMPKATRVASLDKWNRMGYKVKKGSKALKILAPTKYKYAEIDGKRVRYKFLTKKQKKELQIKEHKYFILVPVFDFSQVVKVKDNGYIDEFICSLEGDNEEIYTYLKSLIIEDGIKVIEKDLVIKEGVLGASFGGYIEIKNDTSTSMVITIIHEWAHELLHKGSENETYSKQYKEAQAEATSYIVCKHLGINNIFSSDYIQAYGNSVEDLKKNFKEIMKASTYIIERIREGKKVLKEVS